MRISRIRMLTAATLVAGVSLVIFQNCSPMRASLSGASADSSSTSAPSAVTGTPSPTTTPSPNLTPANRGWVDANLTLEETCTKPFEGTLPAGIPTDEIGPFPVTPITYFWDFARAIFWTERDRYGYVPRYQPNHVGFAANGRPLIRSRDFKLQTLTDQGNWKSTDLLALARESMRLQGYTWTAAAAGQFTTTAEYADPTYSTESRVVFDNECHVYALINANRSSLGMGLLLHSNNGGQHWRAYPIPGSNGGSLVTTMELPTSRHTLLQTPVLSIRNWYEFSGSPQTLNIVVPSKNPDGTLAMGSTYQVAVNTIAEYAVGGGENSMVSFGDKIHIVYPGRDLVQDPISGRRGAAIYATSFSRSLKRLITTATIIGVAVNSSDIPLYDDNGNPNHADEHNQPTLAVDSNGFLHALLGGHHGPLYYLRSATADQTATWSEIEIVGQKPGVPGTIANYYTYPSMVIDSNSQPIIAARYASDGYHFNLVTNYRDVASGKWQEQKIIVDPDRGYYGHWYNKLSIDPRNRVFLSYMYYPDQLFADERDMFAKKFNLTLTAYPDADANNKPIPCLITNHDAPVPHYCAHSGYEPVNPTVMMSLRGQPFEFATTRTFFKF